ncbi:hypothetical protein PVAP13_1NG027636 [Panicum virgatum]|uniref:Uncharacterized protein n=1 Tax=Panicum virgatum TaxID=38727 RepID=A0A8T0WRQ1_PANVG|nr:hypothetical protein PVAP13_1NG027636 [Panicum virgatum]
MRMRRSADSFLWMRWSANSRRSLSTSARSSGVPASGSNSHTARPRKPLVDRSYGPPPSATSSLHMLLGIHTSNRLIIINTTGHGVKGF